MVKSRETVLFKELCLWCTSRDAASVSGLKMGHSRTRPAALRHTHTDRISGSGLMCSHNACVTQAGMFMFMPGTTLLSSLGDESSLGGKEDLQ